MITPIARLIRRHPMAALLTSICSWFLLTAATSATLAATGGETSGLEAALIVAGCLLSMAGMGTSLWLFNRYEQRQHDEFMRRLDEPTQPSRITLWHPPTTRP